MLSVSIGSHRIALTHHKDGAFHVFASEQFGFEARHKNQKKAHAEIIRMLKDLLS